jgi:hypothetical protein
MAAPPLANHLVHVATSYRARTTYRAVCTCGWESPRQGMRSRAQQEGREHARAYAGEFFAL